MSSVILIRNDEIMFSPFVGEHKGAYIHYPHHYRYMVINGVRFFYIFTSQRALNIDRIIQSPTEEQSPSWAGDINIPSIPGLVIYPNGSIYRLHPVGPTHTIHSHTVLWGPGLEYSLDVDPNLQDTPRIALALHPDSLIAAMSAIYDVFGLPALPQTVMKIPDIVKSLQDGTVVEGETQYLTTDMPVVYLKPKPDPIEPTPVAKKPAPKPRAQKTKPSKKKA